MVLAQQDKTWMDTEAQAALRGYQISWQTREGAPYSANDLNRVSAGSAETIILMRPENGRVCLSLKPLDTKPRYPTATYIQVVMQSSNSTVVCKESSLDQSQLSAALLKLIMSASCQMYEGLQLVCRPLISHRSKRLPWTIAQCQDPGRSQSR